jgi:hypothetical protein
LSPDHDEDLPDFDEPRSIFSALWFRVVVVVLVLGVGVALALPYLLDVIAPSVGRTTQRDAGPQSGAPTARASKPALPIAVAEPTPSVASAVVGRATVDVPAGPDQKAVLTSPPAAAEPPKETPAVEARKPTAAASATPPKDGAATERRAKNGSGAAKEQATANKDAASKRPAAGPGRRLGAASPAGTGEPARPATKAAAPVARGAGGGYLVQIGAFRDPETAKRVAESLRAKKFTVDESIKPAAAPTPTTVAEADRYSVVVSGRPAEEIASALGAKSLRGEHSGDSWTLVPALPLAEAVALSRALAVDGFSVQVRRAAAPAPVAANGGAEPLHRVRVGPYPDRAAAVAALRQLEGAGYKPFIARGSE